MKLLYLCNGYPPHRSRGTETYTAGLATGFHRRGNTVEVLCAGEWDTGSRYWNGVSDELRAGVLVRRIHLNWKKAPDPYRYLYDNPLVAQFLEGYLEKFKPDLVHITSCETLSASILHVVHALRLPLILSLTDFWFLCPRIHLVRSDSVTCSGSVSTWDCLRCQLHGAKIYRWSSRLLPEDLVARLIGYISRHPILNRQRGLRGMAGQVEKRRTFLREALTLADCRLTASAYLRRVFQANGVSAPIRIHAYGHDLGWIRSYHGKTASDIIRVGFIGQVVPSKGLHVLLEAARSVESAIGGRFALRIYGNLEREPEYGARIRSLVAGLSDIRFCGTYAHDLSATVFSEIDVLVVPSLWPDFPLVIHEAFAAETPVIVSNLDSMNELITHDVNGLCFEVGDSSDLARQLRRVIEEGGLLKRLRGGIPAMKTIEGEMDELEDMYGALLRNKSPKTA
jgi:glycosyltransferase involved in cell wall biosynthesis